MATEHDVVARARVHRVDAAVAKCRGLDPAQGQRQAGQLRGTRARRPDLSAVADHQVVAIARIDRVAVAPADDDVLARTRGDGVNSTVLCRRGRHDLVDIARVRIVACVRPVEVQPGVGDGPVIAQHDVVALAHVQDVAVVATQHDVVARARVHRVDAAVAEGRGFDQANCQ